ncbi:hypothetical protein D9M68_885920 [compost metagenome]
MLLGTGFIQRLGIAGAALEQHLRALMVFLRQIEIGPRLGQFGTGDCIIQADQQGSARNRLAFAEMQGGQASFDLRADHHRLIGAQRAEGDQLVAHQGFFHLDDFDQGAFGRVNLEH